MSLPHQPVLVSAVFPTEHYAAATEVAFTDIDLTAGRITGFAVPEAGQKPCALVLMAGDQIISIARAIRFSDVAREAGKRRGWCGFTVSGMAQAVALASDVQLRCVVSDRIFGQWSGNELSKTLVSPTRTFLSAMGLREELCRDGGCTDYRQVLPFALDLARSRGSRAILEATYQYFLGRAMDPVGGATYLGDLGDAAGIERVWTAFINSDEHRARRLVALPGPFESGFAFPLGGIEDDHS